MNPHTTWYALIDGARARILRREDDGRWLTLSTLEATDARRKSAELGRAGPATVHESASPARHAVEPRVDPHEAAKRDFGASVVERLNEAFRRGEFDRLVVAAPPRLLPTVRDTLDAALCAVTHEITKDLTKLPVAELDEHLLQNRGATV